MERVSDSQINDFIKDFRSRFDIVIEPTEADLNTLANLILV
jgi:hypothetical protein